MCLTKINSDVGLSRVELILKICITERHFFISLRKLFYFLIQI